MNNTSNNTVNNLKKKYGFNHSLSMKMAVILLGMTAAVVLLSWLFNSVFLEKYYINQTSSELVDSYDMINKAFEDDSIYIRETVVNIIGECEKSNISFLIVDESLQICLSSGFSVNGDNLVNRLKDLIFYDDTTKEDIILEKEAYSVYTIVDSSTGGSYLEMYGTLNTGELFLMRVSIDGIRDSIAVSNRFYVYVAISMLIFCTVVIIFVTRKVTKPVKNLAQISERMSRMDFSVKYEGGEEDEIGILGASINTMSKNLENSIRELKNANMELTKDIAKKDEIDQMRKEFLSNVSHELKTPIALIQGYAEGLKESVNDDVDSMNFYCDVITDEAAKMNKMVMKLLTLNQIEFGSASIDMERFDIVEIIKQILANFKVMLDSKNIKIVFDDSIPVFVWADEFVTAEVITNYISNAINHIDFDKIIFISMKKMGKNIRISIKNTGENIPENEIENIWQKFYKVDKSRTREYGGNGIGLSIVKAIMESMQKDYGVKNVSGGVEFFFELELAKTTWIKS